LEQQLHKKCTKAFSVSLSPNSPGPASSERRKVMCFASHNCNAATTTEREREAYEREREREREREFTTFCWLLFVTLASYLVSLAMEMTGFN
jgi:hypothetical protein